MKSGKPPINIHQSRSGITLLDGFYLIRNPRTQKINVISISNGVVYIHDVTRHMTLQSLVSMDASGQIDIFEKFKMTESEKQKNNKTKK